MPVTLSVTVASFEAAGAAAPAETTSPATASAMPKSNALFVMWIPSALNYTTQGTPLPRRLLQPNLLRAGLRPQRKTGPRGGRGQEPFRAWANLFQ